MKLGIKNTVIFIIITTVIIISVLSFSDAPTTIDRDQIKSTFLIDYPSKFNYRQTVNDCGPFNTAAVVRALKKREVDSEEFAEKIGWRLPNKYTLPWGIEKQLEENDIVIEKPDLKTLSDDEKILFLQQQLSQGKPIIILGERNSFEHYVTIFGFDLYKDEFYIYDSFYDKKQESEGGMTKDDNADFPGNRTFSSEELLVFWQDGGMYRIYDWYAVVTSL